MEKNANFVKNYGFWLRYNSRSGTHNMYKEYRDISLVAAAQQMCTCLCLCCHRRHYRIRRHSPCRHSCVVPCSLQTTTWPPATALATAACR